MARMIDAVRFGEILEQWKKDCLEDNDIQGAEIILDVILQLDDMPTLTQPNEPLTLEELREMDGEPVWGKSLITGKPGEWFILRVVEMSKTWFIACAGAEQGFGDKDTYGETWVAYRRPPEGEEEEKHVIEITENL